MLFCNVMIQKLLLATGCCTTTMDMNAVCSVSSSTVVIGRFTRDLGTNVVAPRATPAKLVSLAGSVHLGVNLSGAGVSFGSGVSGIHACFWIIPTSDLMLLRALSILSSNWGSLAEIDRSSSYLCFAPPFGCAGGRNAP